MALDRARMARQEREHNLEQQQQQILYHNDGAGQYNDGGDYYDRNSWQPAAAAETARRLRADTGNQHVSRMQQPPQQFRQKGYRGPPPSHNGVGDAETMHPGMHPGMHGYGNEPSAAGPKKQHGGLMWKPCRFEDLPECQSCGGRGIGLLEPDQHICQHCNRTAQQELDEMAQQACQQTSDDDDFNNFG